jgi:hypothetical protein
MKMSPGTKNEYCYYPVIQHRSLTLENQWVAIGKAVVSILVLLVIELNITCLGNYVCITCQIPLQNMS